MRLTDQALHQAVLEASAGMVDAHPGGNLIKKRVRLEGRGKRGSTRTIIATCFEERWFFLYGFEKNRLSDISNRELKSMQFVAGQLLGLPDSTIAELIASGEIIEVRDEQKET